ncbi:MAG TPA: dihydroorotase family protein [Candidatus Bathyarchaeia archaeon]|nr:dihydroorotase family protein [Candidatus Bathyarchaeia archaeon]
MNHLKSPKTEKTSGPPSLLIRDAHIWTNNETTRGSILIEDGRIQRIARKITEPVEERILANRLLVLPGLVDAHVHLRDMKLSYKEDFTTGTAAAAAGGFTTVLDMPNSQPPTDSVEHLKERAARASRRIFVNVGFHAAALDDQQAAKAMKSAGAFSMKLYMPSPIAPLDVNDDAVVVRVMRAAKQASLPLTVHAEDATILPSTGEINSFRELVRSRRGNAETSAVRRILRLQQRIGCRVHFCHVSLPSSLSAIANRSSSRLSSEVTPHHTLLSENNVKTLGWKAWMVPPLRSRKDMGSLFRAMATGTSTIIATDHAPHTIKEKTRTPRKSPPGIPGLETALPLMLTMVNKGKLSLGRLVSLLSTNPVKVFGLGSKERLENGADADLVLVDLKKRGKIDPGKFFSKARYSPFEDWKTQGAVHTTVVNGSIIYSNEEIIGKAGAGKVLRSGRHE